MHQISYDDKGLTFLASFGLPWPRSHEREAPFALNTALQLKESFDSYKFANYSISLATGNFYCGTVGNLYRLDTAIVGEAVINAVRFLNLPECHEQVVCDLSTTQEAEGTFSFNICGKYVLKGRSTVTDIYRVTRFPQIVSARGRDDADAKAISAPVVALREPEKKKRSVVMIGYLEQRRQVLNLINSWLKSKTSFKNCWVVVIEGNHGAGKSMFYRALSLVLEKRAFYTGKEI